jgi:hypothetical protein
MRGEQMGTMLEAIQNAIIPEPEAEAQPGTTLADDGAIETQLTQEISDLWSDHVRLSASRKATAKELRQIRASLAERLHAMKSLLSRPGRGGQWRSWLRERGIPRSTADRLVARHAETLGIENGNVPTGAISNSPDDSAEKLAKSVWQRFRKTLATYEAVIQFIGCIAEISGVGHEQRAEGLVIFKPAPKAADGLAGSAPPGGPVQQSSNEAPAITEEPVEGTAATPPAAGQAAAVANAGSGGVQQP